MKIRKLPSTKTAGKVLREFCDILDGMTIGYAIDGGTLLGMFRDGDFCQDDQDDIDITCTYSPIFMHEILDRACAAGFKIYKTWRDGIQSTAQLSVKKSNVKIDLMFKRMKNGKVWWTVYRGKGLVYKAVDEKWWTEVHDIETKYGPFHVPGKTDGHTEGYLSERYGDWKTPVHRDNYSCYSTDKSIIKSYEEI